MIQDRFWVYGPGFQLSVNDSGFRVGHTIQGFGCRYMIQDFGVRGEGSVSDAREED